MKCAPFAHFLGVEIRGNGQKNLNAQKKLTLDSSEQGLAMIQQDKSTGPFACLIYQPFSYIFGLP